MKIEIWSDYVCPFCFIGKRRLEEALDTFPHRDSVNVVYRSFELDPNAATMDDRSVYDMLAQKYGMTLDQAKATTAQVAAQARALGLDYDFDNMVVTGTFDAHRLTHYAATIGKAATLTEALLTAYFIEGKHIGRPDVLADIAHNVGMDRQAVETILAGADFTDAVRAEEEMARRLGVSGVPFFVFDGKYAVSGAQPTDVFRDVLDRVWNERQPETAAAAGEQCSDTSCDL